MKNFADRVYDKVEETGAPICVGLDPRLNQIPDFIIQKAISNKDLTPFGQAKQAILDFNKGIIDSVCHLVPAIKPQIAFYEMFGAEGIEAYIETIKYAHEKQLLVIADAKRNDIGSTADAYAKAFLGETAMFDEGNEVISPAFDADCLTVNAYLGYDGIKPFLEECDKYKKGIFVLVKTSNSSSGDLQDLVMQDGSAIYEIMGSLVDSWGADLIGEHGYSPIGAVVGATYPKQAEKLRHLMPNSLFLVPGYGAQGGTAEDVKPCFKEGIHGALVNSSRGIIFAYQKKTSYDEKDFGSAAAEAVLEMKNDLVKVLH